MAPGIFEVAMAAIRPRLGSPRLAVAVAEATAVELDSMADPAVAVLPVGAVSTPVPVPLVKDLLAGAVPAQLPEAAVAARGEPGAQEMAVAAVMVETA